MFHVGPFSYLFLDGTKTKTKLKRDIQKLKLTGTIVRELFTKLNPKRDNTIQNHVNENYFIETNIEDFKK